MPIGNGMHSVPLSTVPVSSNVRRDVVPGPGAVHGRVERVEGFEHVERARVGVEQLTDKRRSTALVRQQNDRGRSDPTNVKILPS